MSRELHLAEGCTLRFPGRSNEFAEGVEVGILAAQMDMGEVRIPRWVGAQNVEQIRSIADKLGYRLTCGERDGDFVRIELWRGSSRPRLSIVRSS